MNARERALDRFCEDMEEVLHVMVQEGQTYDDALDELLSEYDDFFRAILEEEIQDEEIVAG